MTTQYVDIERMREVSEEEGWSIDYRQLQVGPLKATATSWQIERVSLIYESANSSLRVIGESPPGATAALIPNINERLWANGQWLNDSEMIIYHSGDEVHLVTDHDRPTSVISMHVPTAALLPALGNFGRVKPGVLGANSAPLVCRRGAISGLRRLMFKSGHREATDNGLPVSEARLLNRLAELISYSRENEINSVHQAIKRKEQVLIRADRFLNSHSQRQFTIPDLARAVYASERTLERIFKSEFDLTPSDYVAAHRLHSARKELLRPGAQKKSIAQIALDNGFSHIGRFSAVFQTQFGLSPSEFRLQQLQVSD